jgi:hypothetical protein
MLLEELPKYILDCIQLHRDKVTQQTEVDLDDFLCNSTELEFDGLPYNSEEEEMEDEKMEAEE